MSTKGKFFGRVLSSWLAAGSHNGRVFVLDAVCLVFAVYLGYALRLTFFITGGFRYQFAIAAAVFTPVVLAVLFIGKIYSISWPQASVEEYARLFRWYIAAVIVFCLISYIPRRFVVPRSSLAIMSFAALLMLVGMRATWRLLLIYQSGDSARGRRTLIIGTGEPAAQLARSLTRGDSQLRPVGFIDEDQQHKGLIIASLKVLGAKDDIPKVIKDYSIETVLIALASPTGPDIKSYMDILAPCGVTVRVLPSITELADGQVSVSRLRSVKLEDLLRRDPVHLDDAATEKLIKGKTVLVTGAGGSIGSEICRQVLAKGPKEVIALGHGEQSIYLLMESLADKGIASAVRPVIADISDRETMDSVFTKYSPQVVFHAAAHKHVPLMEFNPREALRVNAYGTWNIADVAGTHGVERFVMISTDKAVHPSSVMGATKRIAERLLFSVSSRYPATQYMAVRFGNVLGSRGSVVPKFEKQIEHGGPVTVTHKDMKRYFMLIPEAVSLVLQAGAIGSGGSLFVLDMGEPVNITEMAETLIRLHGHEPYTEIPIVFTGIRPGEKLYEELFYDPAHVDRTSNDKIFLTRLAPEKESILPKVQEILRSSGCGEMSPEELSSSIFTLGSKD